MPTVSGLAPWLALAGLGAFHGVNPAMGWLFAVALALHRGEPRTVVVSLLPIAAGHALSVGAVVALALFLGFVVDRRLLEIAAGAVLLAWAAWHALYGHRRRVRIGMQTGMAGLALWSFLMATAHGAGLMLIPVVLPLCLTDAPAGALSAAGSLPVALAAIGVHTAAMLAMAGTVAVVVYHWVGLEFLRRGWINLDLLWVVALAVTGFILLI